MRCESGPIGFLSIIWARSEENSEGVGNTFVGVSSAPPGGGEETACYLVNGQILIDTGWNAAANMQLDGAQPTDVDCVFFHPLPPGPYAGFAGWVLCESGAGSLH